MYSKTCLHFFTKDSKESIFWHLLEENLEPKVGETFDYSKFYPLLDKESQKDFNISKLPLSFSVERIWYSDKDNTRYIDLKAI